jgi:hypothetical protein
LACTRGGAPDGWRCSFSSSWHDAHFACTIDEKNEVAGEDRAPKNGFDACA